MTRPNLRAGRMAAAAAAVALLPCPLRAEPAQGATSGDWVFASEEGLSGAFTVNGEGAAMGLICGRSCINYVESSRPCRESAVYEGMMEGAIGAFPIIMTCRFVQGRHALTWRADETFIQVISAGGELKIVIPAEQGAIGTHRFSLRGSYEAVYAALHEAAAREEEAAGTDSL